ncbi:S41 family peptidase [Geobacter sp. SVR]|uniref:S41 family peptidase n=1 Tax=Geobacter sp. SVR TaxID=2495594 RepID=UPI00143F033B|nr:S41 family peptidase [Geobacter sp. SVR]BCS53092.1 peptidase S41 [Geobacter sp. SVR]GCF84477.1 peptidase S41 [Geobacter sp. SVR]
MRTKYSWILAIATVIAIVLTLALIIGYRWHALRRQADSTYLSLLSESYAAVKKHYVEKPDGQKLVKSMVDGMLASLDPHSAYLPPEPYKEMEVQISGAFGGVGIELGMKDGRLIVIAPIDDTPAFRAGIHPNDNIWKIDGITTRGMTIPAAVKLMRGERGTPVTLGILRNGNPQLLTFNLVRDIIKVKSIKTRMLASGYGLIRIAQFQERTGSEFRQGLKELNAAAGGTLKGLVIDLRYNPGGLLGPAVEVANCFIGDDINDTLIVSTKGRTPESNLAYHASLGTKEPHYPIVVLVNGGSASASEIVAGALQDHRRAVVMGRQSFGKGSVQTIYPLPGNAALKLTTARYYTPSGRSIQARGIVPDVEVGNGRPVDTSDPKEIKIREADLGNRLAPDEKDKAGGATTEPPSAAAGGTESDLDRDNQLKRALDLLKSLVLVREQGLMPPK